MNLNSKQIIFLAILLNFCSGNLLAQADAKKARELSNKMLSLLTKYSEEIKTLVLKEKPQEINPLKKLNKYLSKKSRWCDFLTECKKNNLFQKPSLNGEIVFLPYPYFHAKELLNKFSGNLENITVERGFTSKNLTTLMFCIDDWKIRVEVTKNGFLLMGFAAPGITDLFIQQTL